MWLFAASLGVSADPYSSAIRYPQDVAAQLVSEDDVRTFTVTKARLRDVSEQAAALLVSRPIPLGDIAVAAESKPRQLKPSGAQWEMPPFADVDPPPPQNLPPAAKALWNKLQAENRGSVAAPVFGDLPTSPYRSPSALLRPRPSLAGQRQLSNDDMAIPEAFSCRRYQAPEGGFFQISLYGGTNSFAAENAYRALRHAAENRENLEGVGKSAFLTHVTPPDVAAAPPPAEVPSRPFDDVPVVGQPRPDLLDPSLVQSRTAPAFATVGVPVKAPPPPRKKAAAPAPEPERKPEVVLLVFYLPEKSVTVELALDDRLGTVQHLVGLGLLVNQKLLNQW